MTSPSPVLSSNSAWRRTASDLLTSIDGVEFDECWRARVAVDIAGTAVPFIDIDHLVINKRASGRLQDLADVEALTDVGSQE
jgi:hypothetical protein